MLQSMSSIYIFDISLISDELYYFLLIVHHYKSRQNSDIPVQLIIYLPLILQYTLPYDTLTIS